MPGIASALQRQPTEHQEVETWVDANRLEQLHPVCTDNEIEIYELRFPSVIAK
jgi:hypothetical protein